MKFSMLRTRWWLSAIAFEATRVTWNFFRHNLIFKIEWKISRIFEWSGKQVNSAETRKRKSLSMLESFLISFKTFRLFSFSSISSFSSKLLMKLSAFCHNSVGIKFLMFSIQIRCSQSWRELYLAFHKIYSFSIKSFN